MSDKVALREQALELLAAGEYRPALPAFWELARHDPDNAGWPLQAAELAEMAGHKVQTVIAYQAALKLLLEQGQLARAATAAGRLLQLDPPNAAGLKALEAASAAPVDPAAPALILYVDDDPFFRTLVSALLCRAGHKVVLAADGLEALARAFHTPPRLIITDVMMPKMDGWTLVKRLRSRAELARVPVIFLTGLATGEDRIRGFRLGADDYLAKTFQPDELEVRVGSVLRRAPPETAPAPVKAASPPGVAPGAAAARAPAPDLTGSLAELGVAAVLSMLDAERKSGQLLLRSGGGQARLWVRGGRILRMDLDGKTVKDHFVGACQLMRIEAGNFEYTRGEVPAEENEAALPTTTMLLLEAARRLDEGTDGPEAEVVIPTGDDVF